MGEYDLFGMQAIQWGSTHESVAIKQAKDFEVTQVGSGSTAHLSPD